MSSYVGFDSLDDVYITIDDYVFFTVLHRAK